MKLVSTVTLIFFMALSTQIFAQSGNATLGGTVSDASGALIPGVTVTATNTQTGIVSTVLSNEAGAYNFASLQPGVYRVSAELSGFQTQNYTDVQLGTSQQARLNFALQVGSVATEVQVSVAVDTLLATSSSSVGTVLPEYTVRELPIVGRDALELVNIMAGVREAADPTQAAQRGNATIAGISVSAANTTRDGISVSDGRYNLGVFSATHVNPDLVGELRIILAPVDAETGRGAGQVQILTRSGTNRYQGSAVWNIQNSALNAAEWNDNRTGATPDWYNRHQLSVNYGGPIVRNKTFFFALFDGQRMYSRVNVNAAVLTAEARKGNFRFFPGVVNGDADSAIVGGANPQAPVVDVLGNPIRPAAATGDLQSFTVFGRDPLRAGFDRTGFVQRVIAGMPLPNTFTDGDGLNSAVYRWVRRQDSLIGGQQGVEDDTNRNQMNIKVDHNFNANHKLSVNWTYERQSSTTSQENYPGNDWEGKTFRRPQVVTSGFTSTLSPNLVNEFRFGLRRASSLTRYPFDHPDTIDEVLAYLPSANGYPVIGAPLGYSNNILNPGLNTNGNRSPLWTYADSLSWTQGRHAFKGGVEFRFARTWGINTANGIPHVSGGAGNFAPQNIETNLIPGLIGGNLTNMRNLLLTLSGSLQNVSQAFVLNDPTWTAFRGYGEEKGYEKERQFNQNEWSTFFKDDWKLLPSLTLNLGLRYEYYGVPYEANGLTGAVIGGGMAGFGWTGRSFADYWQFGPRKGDLTAVEFVGPNSPNPDKQIYQDDWNNFAPAVGFSWSLPWFGKDKTTLRGGYGISYQGGGRGLDLDTAITTNLPGLGDSKTIIPSTFTDLSTLVLPLPRNKPLEPVSVTQRNSALTVWDPNYVSPYVQNITLSATREVRRNVALDVRYIGTRGVKLFGTIPINQANYMTNGLLEALNITRAGGDAPLFDQMLQGIVVNVGQAAVGSGGVTGSAALRQSNTFRGNIANGNYTAVANSLNTSTLGSPAGTSEGGSLLRRNGFPENFIVNNPQFSGVTLNTNPGSSTYHSLQVQTTFRPTAGVSFQSTYVWSKGMASGTGGWLNPLNRSLNTGIQSSHRTHDFRTNGSFELPFGPNRMILGNSTGIVARLLEQWQVSWIANVNSGQPLDIGAINSYIGGGRAQIVGDFPKDQGKAQMTDALPVYFAPGTYQLVADPQCASVTTLQATQTACTNRALADAQGRILLRNAAPGTLGNLGDKWIEGPGTFRLDMSASKTVRISESKSVQVRVDARNVLNHPLLGNPNTDINSANFGQIGAGSVTGARQFQAQLRLSF